MENFSALAAQNKPHEERTSANTSFCARLIGEKTWSFAFENTSVIARSPKLCRFGEVLSPDACIFYSCFLFRTCASSCVHVPQSRERVPVTFSRRTFRRAPFFFFVFFSELVRHGAVILFLRFALCTTTFTRVYRTLYSLLTKQLDTPCRKGRLRFGLFACSGSLISRTPRLRAKVLASFARALL